MAAGGEIAAFLPFLFLQLDIAVLLLLAHLPQQDAEAVSGGVLRSQGDEDELHAHFAQLGESHGIRVVEPLEARRPVEGETRLWEAAADLVAELAHWSAVAGG